MLGVRYLLQGSEKVTSTHYATSRNWYGQMMEASCYRSYSNEMHHAPELDCTCGYYAFSSLENLDGIVDNLAEQAVVVIVDAYGKVIVHDKGFRAQYMQPKYVVHPVDIVEMKLFTNAELHNGAIIMNGSWQPARTLTTSLFLSSNASRLLSVPIVTLDIAKQILQ